MHRALGGWMLSRAPASPSQSLHRHETRYYKFFYLFLHDVCGLEKLGLVDQNRWKRDMSALSLRTLDMGSWQQSELIDVALYIQ